MPKGERRAAGFLSIDAMLQAIDEEATLVLEELADPDGDATYALQSIRRIIGLVRSRVRSVAPKTGSKNDAYMPLRRPGGKAVTA
jgi:hypothetical protein